MEDIKWIEIVKITPYENNPRNNDLAVDGVKKSIQEFGFKVPLVLDKKGVIITGHTRFEAAKRLGMEKVPCVIADDLTEEKARAFRLADNRTAEMAEWNFDLLNQELKELEEAGEDLTEYGFVQINSLLDEAETHTEEFDDDLFEDFETLFVSYKLLVDRGQEVIINSYLDQFKGKGDRPEEMLITKLKIEAEKEGLLRDYESM